MRSSFLMKAVAAFLVVIAAVLAQSLPARASYGQFYPGYCTYYAAQKFDQTAPSPQCNWNGNAAQWAGNARASGWNVTTSVTAAVRGAVVVWSGGGFGHVAYVESVTASGVNISEMNWGRLVDPVNGITTNFNKVTTAYLSYASGLQRGGYSFAGYVLPTRQGAPPPNNVLVPLYRYRSNWGRGDRFYTTNFGELGYAGFGGWVFEGIQCHVYASQVSGAIPLYRYSSSSLGLHFYTTQNVDLSGIGYHMEGIQCYVYSNSVCYTDPNITPLYRYYNTWNNSHFYTTNWGELGGGGGDWRYEGIECNVRR